MYVYTQVEFVNSLFAPLHLYLQRFYDFNLYSYSNYKMYDKVGFNLLITNTKSDV